MHSKFRASARREASIAGSVAEGDGRYSVDGPGVGVRSNDPEGVAFA